MGFQKRRWLVTLLLGGGIVFWLTQSGDRPMGWQGWIGAAVGLAVALVPALNRRFELGAARLNRWLRKHTVWVALAIGIVYGSYLVLEAHLNHDEMFTRIHDEHSYLIEARLMAEGKLWHSGYPADVAPFFDTFYLFVHPVYASMYFPGTALLETPCIWLHWPYWAMPAFCGAASAALFFLICMDIFGGLMALSGTLLLVTRPYVRLLSLMLLSEMPEMVAILAMFAAWLRWRRGREIRWAVATAAAAGWAGITRPLDALCFALPVAIAMIWEILACPSPGQSGRAALGRTAAFCLMALSPFAVLQIVQNVGITGKWDEFPEARYHLLNFSVPAMGFGPYDVSRLPQGISAAKQKFAFLQLDLYLHRTFAHELAAWYSTRFIELRFVTLPAAVLTVLIPIALARWRDVRRLVFAAGLVLFAVGYFITVYQLNFYMIPATPAVVVLVLAGWEGLQWAWPRQRRVIAPVVALTLIGMSAWQLPEINSSVRPVLPSGEQLKQIAADCQALPAGSVVLFPFDEEKISLNSYPVFNEDVAWPDDAPIVRATDLGAEQNWKLFDYYAHIQPGRRFYRYDGGGEDAAQRLKFLGTARELAAQHDRT
jgi:hypothetical protein